MVFGGKRSRTQWGRFTAVVMILLALPASLFYSSKYTSCTQPANGWHMTSTPKNSSASSPSSSSVPHYVTGEDADAAALSSDSSGNVNHVHVHVHVLSILRQLQISQYEAASIMKSNSSEYNWLANSFVNPPGVPTFNARQIKAYFERRNVLFIGDSTSRRVSNNIYGIITADNLDDVKVHETDYDVKTTATDCSSEEQDRAMLKVDRSFKGIICKDVIVGDGSYKGNGDNRTPVQADTPSSDTTNSNNSSTRTQMIRKKTVRFDRMNAECYKMIEWQWREANNNNTEQSLLNQHSLLNPGLQAMYEDYDLVIISLGIWDSLKAETCQSSWKDANWTSPLTPLRGMLNAMERNNPNDLQVVIRTAGFDAKQQSANNSLSFEFNDILRDFAHNMTMTAQGNNEKRHNNFTVVDWGSVISKRSFGEDKIVSRDWHGSHYGLDARLLTVQQLMHELVKADLMKANAL